MRVENEHYEYVSKLICIAYRPGTISITLLRHVITWITTHLPTTEGRNAELSW